MIDEQASSLPDCPVAADVAPRVRHTGDLGGIVNVLVQLAVSMRAHGRGGIAARWCPPSNATWRESIVQPIPYAVVPPFAELAELLASAPPSENDERARLAG